MKTYLVGGAVRDQLLGYPVKERDWVVVGASPEEMLARGYQQVGKDFPVFLHPESKEEYALARTERKSGRGYTGFTCYSSPDVTLEEDLPRRDLTINAMAQDTEGRLVDPYHGRRDLEQRLLRHVSPAFAEDPLRILRVARFAARYVHLGFKVAPETLALMRSMVTSGEVSHLVAERIWKETERALGERSPAVYIEVLRECGALAVLFPEVEALFGVPQRADYHPEVDTGRHLLLALEQASLLSADTRVRFAVLMHDLGKGTTPPDQWPRHIGHEQRGIKLVNGLCDRIKVPNEFRDLALLVSQYHTHCHRALELKPSTVLKLLEQLDVFRRPKRLEPFLQACEADARGREGLDERAYPQPELIRQAWQVASAIDTGAIIAEGFKGKQIGEQLRQRRIAAIAELRRDFQATDAESHHP